MNFEVVDFEGEVLAASQDLPVLVDFWADWCAPCRMLGPVLEKLAGEDAGSWKLAKVDTEAHREVSARYAIRSIPAVKLFIKGQVVAEFTGALPEPAVRKWLEENLPGESHAAVEEARGLLFRDPGAAIQRVSGILPGSRDFPVAEAITTLGRMLLDVTQAPPPPGPGRTLYLTALEQLGQGRIGEALDHLVQAVEKDPSYHGQASRKACLALFQFLGPESPITREFRSRLAAVLYR